MAIKLGTTDINRVYLGETEIRKIYLGTTVIYEITSGSFVTFPTGGTGSADFEADALDAGWTEAAPGAAGYSGWAGWTYANGRAVADFTASDQGDPGTGSTAGQDAPRLVTDIADGDFQIDYAMASAIYEDQTGTSQYVGVGFYIELSNGDSARLDHYRISGNDETRGFRDLAGTSTSTGIDPVNAAGDARGNPGFFRLTRVGDQFTVYTSYDGVTFNQSDQFTWAVTVAKVGVMAYKIGTTHPATIALEYIHLNQTGAFSVDTEPGTSTVLTETFTDLSNWTVNNSGSATIAADGDSFNFTVPANGSHSARLMFPTAKTDAGMLMKVSTTAIGSSAGQGFFCPAFRQRGALIEPFGQAVGYVFEMSAQEDEIRIVSSQGADYDGALFDGVYSFLEEDLALSGFGLEANVTWLRVENFGPVLRWRYWTDGNSEPSTWAHTVYDITIPESGLLGIVMAHNDNQDAALTAEITHLEVYDITQGSGGASGNFTFSVAQSANNAGGGNDPATVTLTSNITAGNLLIAFGGDRSGGDPANYTVTDNNGKTWTRADIDLDNSVGGDEGNTRVCLTMFWREVDTTGETDTTPQVSLDDGTANGKWLQVIEIAPSAAYNWTYRDGAVAGSGASDWSGQSSGNASPTGDDIFEIAIGLCRTSTDEPTTGNISFATQTDGGTESMGGNNQVTSYAAFEATSQAAGTKSATLSSDGSGNEGIVAVATWSNG